MKSKWTVDQAVAVLESVARPDPPLDLGIGGCERFVSSGCVVVPREAVLALLDEVERLAVENGRLMVELSILGRNDEGPQVQP